MFSYRVLRRLGDVASGKPIGPWGEAYLARKGAEAVRRHAKHSRPARPPQREAYLARVQGDEQAARLRRLGL